MTPDEIEAMFTGEAGFRFARWVVPVAPVVFGVEEATLATVKGAFEAVSVLTGHRMAETDPEFGSNCMMFFFRDWAELGAVPDLDRIVPDLGRLTARLEAQGAERYRLYRFAEEGSIRAAFVFLRMGGALADQPAEDLALAEAVQVALVWSEAAFADRSPLGVAGGRTILRPDVAGLLVASYDPVLPASSSDPSLALRLAARMGAGI